MGKYYLNPPEKVLDTIEAIYDDLPENAQDEFLDDDIILRRVNAARKAFNRWMDKTKRNKEMPSAMEAGPAKYPQDKADRLRRYAHEGKEELNERLNKSELLQKVQKAGLWKRSDRRLQNIMQKKPNLQTNPCGKSYPLVQSSSVVMSIVGKRCGVLNA